MSEYWGPCTICHGPGGPLCTGCEEQLDDHQHCNYHNRNSGESVPAPTPDWAADLVCIHCDALVYNPNGPKFLGKTLCSESCLSDIRQDAERVWDSAPHA